MFSKENFKIPLDKFINLALYHPKKGYYMKNNPFGVQGDFVTAPNISKIFSEMIFIWIISYWEKFHKNKKINIVELGAGNGEMMLQIINSAKNFNRFFNNCNFIIYEKSKKLIKEQKIKLKKNKVKWTGNFLDLNSCPTLFIGNEFLDALPIKQFFKLKNSWYEKYIQKSGKKFIFTKNKCDIKKIEKKLKMKLSHRQNFLEISFEQIRILKLLNSVISKNGGSIIFIDYSYLNQKMFDTLQAVKKHRRCDLLKEVGSSDISHMINIPFLKKFARTLKLNLDYKTQRDFLLNLGIIKRAENLGAKVNFLDKANIFYRVNRLIDKKQMGNLFKVMHLYKKNHKFNLGFK